MHYVIPLRLHNEALPGQHDKSPSQNTETEKARKFLSPNRQSWLYVESIEVGLWLGQSSHCRYSR